MIKKNVFIGFIVGLIANLIGLFLAATLLGKLSDNNDSFIEVFKAAQAEGFLGKLLKILRQLLSIREKMEVCQLKQEEVEEQCFIKLEP